MTNSVQSPEPTQDGGSEVEVIKDLEQRGFHALDSLSLEELQLLTERKRRRLQWEAAERKTQLETEISSIDQQIEELGTRKVALTEELNAVMKSLGIGGGRGERPARRNARKGQKAAEAPPESIAEE
jgi:hypothetical protein